MQHCTHLGDQLWHFIAVEGIARIFTADVLHLDALLVS